MTYLFAYENWHDKPLPGFIWITKRQGKIEGEKELAVFVSPPSGRPSIPTFPFHLSLSQRTWAHKKKCRSTSHNILLLLLCLLPLLSFQRGICQRGHRWTLYGECFCDLYLMLWHFWVFSSYHGQIYILRFFECASIIRKSWRIRPLLQALFSIHATHRHRPLWSVDLYAVRCDMGDRNRLAGEKEEKEREREKRPRHRHRLLLLLLTVASYGPSGTMNI